MYMFTELNLSDMIFSPNHHEPPGASPISPVITKTQIILFSVSSSTLPVHHRDWSSVNSLQEDDQICLSQRGGTTTDYKSGSLSPIQNYLGWCWHSRCRVLKKRTDITSSDTWMKCKTTRRNKGGSQSFEQCSHSGCLYHMLTCNLTLFAWKKTLSKYHCVIYISRMIVPVIFVVQATCAGRWCLLVDVVKG